MKPHPPLFLFAQIDPLANIEVSKIRSCEIIQDTVHFTVEENGAPTIKKAKKSDFIMNQIAEHGITIASNIL
jgi:hypothetical protein